MIDVKTPDSPGWWLMRLSDKLVKRRERIDPLFARYEGNTPLPKVLLDAPDTAQKFYATSRTNLGEMIIKATRYRTKMVSVSTSRQSGEAGDPAAWKLCRKAGLIAESPDIIRNLLVAGDGYAITTMDDQDGPIVTSEDPRQVVTIHDPMRQSRVKAGAKFFHDTDQGISFAYLHLPGRIHVARKAGSSSNPAKGVQFSRSWEWSEEHGGEAGRPLPAGFETDVMIERYRNDEGVGDFERHVDVLDRYDHLVLQGMVIATLQAFKQRGIKVDEQDMPDTDEDTGQEIDYAEMFISAPDALWRLPATAEMWESGAVDVTPIVNMATKQLETVSAVTFTSLSMFTPEGANQSAQGAGLVREGQTFKVEDKQERVGLAHSRVASRLFRLANLDLDTDPDAITFGWAPAERFGLAERADAAVKAKAAGVPWRTIMREIFQFTPDQVARMETERMSDLLLFPAEAGNQPQDAAAGQSVTPSGPQGAPASDATTSGP